MPSTFTTGLRLTIMADGENPSTWGDITSSNLQFIENAITGLNTIALTGDADYTLTASNSAFDQSRAPFLVFTSGGLSTTRNIFIPNGVPKQYVVYNTTSGGQSINIKTSSSSTFVTIPNNSRYFVGCDGTNTFQIGGAGTLTQISTGSGLTGGPVTTSGTVSIDYTASNSWTGGQTFQRVSETVTTLTTASTVVIDMSLATVFNLPVTTNISTLTFSGPSASGKASSFVIVTLANGTSYTVAWPASVKWPASSAPTLTTTSGKQDVFTFVTRDGGSTYLGITSAQNL
jgi:hypothetical protein